MSDDVNDECPDCLGCGEIQVHNVGDPPRDGLLPCPTCMSREFEEQRKECAARIEQLEAAAQWREPTENECAKAALSYRHDYGLLSANVRKYVRSEARDWLYAWWKNIEMVLPAPPAGEQSDDR